MISCIIPTCNRTSFLLEAVQSVLQQTTPPLEILIINNGQNSLDLKLENEKKIRVIETVKNAGASQARNIGASFAKGKFLAFLDDDDLWSPNYLEMVTASISKGARCVISRLDKLYDGKIMPFKNPEGKLTIENFLAFNPGITGSNLVISKDDFLKIGGFDVDLPTSNDKSIGIKILVSGIKLSTLTENQSIHRIHRKERLTDHRSKKAEGTSLFVKKYLPLMNRQLFRFNMLKLYKYQFLDGKIIAIFQFILTKFSYKLFMKLGGRKYGNIKIFTAKKTEKNNGKKHMSDNF